MNKVTITPTKLTITQNRAIKNNRLRARRITEPLWIKIRCRLEQQWNPEQIANETGVSHESIYYHYVYKDKMRHGELYLNLRQGKK